MCMVPHPTFETGAHREGATTSLPMSPLIPTAPKRKRKGTHRDGVAPIPPYESPFEAKLQVKHIS
jgi:hypothetical protein